MKVVFSLSLFTFFLVSLALISNHNGFAQKLVTAAFALVILGVILYLLELHNE